MPVARNRWGHCHQVLAWIDHVWHIGRPVHLTFPELIEPDDGVSDDPMYGETWREGRTLIIAISTRNNITWRETVQTLIHEATHALQYPPAKAELTRRHHGGEFWVKFGEIWERYDTRAGYKKVIEFPDHGIFD